jgi:hypothetical protein
MKLFLRVSFYSVLMGAGMLLLVLGLSLIVRTAKASSCFAQPPRGCSWEVIDSYCTHVEYCHQEPPGTRGCIDILFGQVGCCYVEIGTLIDDGCPQQGCTTFKRCLLGTCDGRQGYP